MFEHSFIKVVHIWASNWLLTIGKDKRGMFFASLQVKGFILWTNHQEHWRRKTINTKRLKTQTGECSSKKNNWSLDSKKLLKLYLLFSIFRKIVWKRKIFHSLNPSEKPHSLRVQNYIASSSIVFENFLCLSVWSSSA